METITKLVKLKNYDKTVFDYALTGFYLIKKEEQNNGLLLTFERDLKGKSVNFYIERTKNYYKYSIPSILPTIILIAISVILLTLFMVFTLINKDEGVSLINILSFLVPGIVIFLIGAAYTFYRTKKIEDYVTSGNKIREEIKNEVLKEIKERDEKFSN